MHRALAVTWKEALDLRKNPGLLASMLALPAVLVLVPTGVVWAWLRHPDAVTFRSMALYYDPTLSLNADPVRFMVDKLVADWFGIFLLMPVFVPILISSQSVAGEKERRTLEPLLAAPVSASELLLGKSLASVVPAVAITWLSFAAFVWRWTPSPGPGAWAGPAQRDVAVRCRGGRAALRLPRERARGARLGARR
jgi:ABC-type transport system involved in multi-copper enzyme maturation permease subunit